MITLIAALLLAQPYPPLPQPKRYEEPRSKQLVPCRTVVMRVNRSFSDGSHEHVCPNCGTSWRHGGRTGNVVSHVCPGFRTVTLAEPPVNYEYARDTAARERKPLLITFTQPNCPPCATLEASLAKLDTSAFVRVTVDINERPDLAAKFKVTSTPTLYRWDQAYGLTRRLMGSQPPNVIQRDMLNSAAPLRLPQASACAACAARR